MAELKRTPGPWFCGNYSWNVETEAGEEIAQVDAGRPNHEADRDFIVRAANCHDELLAACRRLMAVCRELPDDPEFPTNAVIHALAEAASAVAKAAQTQET